MKKIFLAAMSIIILASATFAQQEKNVTTNQQSTTVNDEHLIMKDGKMYHNMNGKEILMQDQMVMLNGTVMHPDGSYHLKNGKQRQLSNGHCMDMNGKKYRSHQMFQRNIMRMHGANMHSGTTHKGMNMSGHH